LEEIETRIFTVDGEPRTNIRALYELKQRLVVGVERAGVLVVVDGYNVSKTAWPDASNARGSHATVTATMPYTPVLGAFFTGGGLAVTLRASSSLAIEY